MDLVLGSLVCVIASFIVAGFGLLLVDPGGSVRRLRGESQAKSTRPAFLTSGPAFEPLQLAEPPMGWPSQNPWPKSRLPKQPWPSETWEGDFFGRKGGAFQSLPQRPEYERPPTPEPERRPQRAQQPAPQEQERPRQKQQQKQQKPAQKPPAPQVQQPGRRSAPSAADVVEWVDKLGLAGAVEKVRAETGWDFQEAAQYLANTLRNHREGR